MGRSRVSVIMRSFCLFLPWIVIISIVTAKKQKQKQTVFPDTRVVYYLSSGNDGGTNNNWTLFSTDGMYGINLPAGVGRHAVPAGDVLSDLMTAGIIDDPYWERNFLTQRHIWMGGDGSDPAHRKSLDNNNNRSSDSDSDRQQRQQQTLEEERRRTRTWAYSTEFDLPYGTNHDGYYDGTYILVLEGIKMGARVSVNGIVLGNVTDQFFRHQFLLNDRILLHGDSRRNDNINSSNISTNHEPAENAATKKTTTILDDERHLVASTTTAQSSSTTTTTTHQLTITFDPTIPTDGRYMASSGGWDWAPYSRAVEEENDNDEHEHERRSSSLRRRVLTFGIVQPIYIVKQRFVSVTHVVPKIYYRGPYARTPLWNGPEGDFQVDVYIHLQCNSETLLDATNNQTGVVVIRNDFESAAGTITEREVSVPFSLEQESKVIKVSLTAPQDVVELWWPNGLGKQRLYNIEVAFRSSRKYQTEWIHKRIGFRTCALVTVNDTDDALVEDAIQNRREGSGSHGMFFRINGAPLWSRGANVVPMDQLEGRLTDEAHRMLVQSAAKANMNILRVWGGGMVLPDSFYDACDEYGILLYHDMMFVDEQHHGPKRTQIIEDEIRFVVRELSFHPSIVLWSGCNECTVQMGSATEIYATFVMQTVAEEDDTRSIWPSCPAAVGWHSGVYAIDGRPSGNPLSTSNRTKGQPPLEVHGPYQRAFSLTYPSVNGFANNWTYNTNIPPQLGSALVGVKFQNHFVSEFGASTFPSFESLSATLLPHHWSVHGGSPPDSCHHVVGNENACNGTNVMAERNYACDSHISAYFGETDLEKVGHLAFRRQLHHCTMAHMLWMKGQIEVLRSTNSFGTMVWQLNENWPTGGWGLLEYGSMAGLKGQVLGGRWTPLMYLLRKALYRDVFASCGVMSGNYTCFCRNDGIREFDGSLQIASLNLITGTIIPIATHRLDIAEGSLGLFHVPDHGPRTNEVYVLTVADCDNNVLIDDYIVLREEPRYMSALVSRNVTINVVSVEVDEMGDALISLRSKGVALYVVLTTLIEGHFDDNAFLLKPQKELKVVKFVPLTRPVDISLLKQSLSIEHLVSYSMQS